MARVSAFQADCCGFESHRPLQKKYLVIGIELLERNSFLNSNH